MLPDNDDCIPFPGFPLVGSAVQTVPEWWSFNTAAPGDCDGPGDEPRAEYPLWLLRRCRDCGAVPGEVCTHIGGPDGGLPRPVPHAHRVNG